MGIQFHFEVFKSECWRAAVIHNLCFYKVHRRCADETPYELVRRFVIERSRIGNLLDCSLIEYDDLIPHRHGFNLVVCDVDHSSIKPIVEATDFHPHLHAKFRIEVAQRFIEQEDLRVSDNCPTDRNTLTFTTGEMLRFTVQEVRNTQNLGGFRDTLVDLCFGIFAKFQPERHVLVHRHVRVEGIVLEDHGNVSIFRWDVVDAFIINIDIAFRYLFQPGDHPQNR